MRQGADVQPALVLRGISKSFGAVHALRDVSLEIAVGEIHGLVGENGAGKSTLIGIAAGSVAADAGTIEIGGKTLVHASPAQAQQLGVSVVYQNPAIVDDLTVLENLLLAIPPRLSPQRSERSNWARACLDRVGLDVGLRQRVAELSPSQRQLLEITKGLALKPSLLILDEPTESLMADQVQRLFERMRGLASSGTAIVYISHRIAEVREIADQITTLRDGKIRGTHLTRNICDEDIIKMVVGRPLSALFPQKSESLEGRPAALTARSLSGAGFHDVSLAVRRGEILGLAGVEGNGQREFIRALAGLGSIESGSVEITDGPVRLHSPAKAAAAGIRYVPADRLRQGLFAPLSVRENVASDALASMARGGLLKSRIEGARVREQIGATAIKTASPESNVLVLSGGNQQKVMFAKALISGPEVMLCDEPTRGVDVGARSEIYSLLRDVADHGNPVIVLSADASELAGLCDSVAIFSRGRVVQVLEGAGITEEQITGAALRGAASHQNGHVDSRQRDGEARTNRGIYRGPQLTGLLRSDLLPAGILLVAACILAGVTSALQPAFLGELNVSLLLYSVAILAFLSMGQLTVMLTGGIDLAVGPLAGLLVVVMSFVIADGLGPGGLSWGTVVVALVALCAGAFNGFLVAGAGLPPIIATLGTYTLAQGCSLFLRSQPGGSISQDVSGVVQESFVGIPVVFVVAVLLAIAAEVVLRHTRLGFALRAVGPGEIAAARMGVRVRVIKMTAYVTCAIFTLIGAVLLAAQIGIGDPTVGTNYTLMTLSAVVLGGASIFGGRGSFVSVFCAALVLGLLANATTFLGIDQAWQFWLPGCVILLAAAMSARLRRNSAGGSERLP